MRYVKRPSWGAEYGRGGTNITPAGVTVHYEGGGKLTGRPHSQCAARVRGIERYHVRTNGWAGIAYTLLVCEHGYVFEGRGLGRRTAANGTNGGNQNYYAVCALIGDKDPLTDVLKSGMRDAIDYLDRNGAGSRINGHRDHLPTSCPGSALYQWVKQGAKRPGAAPKPVPKEDDEVTPNDIEAIAKATATALVNRGINARGREVGQALQTADDGIPQILARLDAQQVTIAELTKTVADLAANGGDVDTDALIARIEQRLEQVTVRLDVPDDEPEPTGGAS